MLKRSDLHSYQGKAVDHMDEHQKSMLWLDLGLGKTISTLTSIVDKMDKFEVYGVLIIAPLRVCQTVWEKEAKNWEHTQHLTFNLVHGKPNHRQWMVCRPANVYLVNYEGCPSVIDEFISQYLNRDKPLPFNMIVYDEITRLKSTRDRQGGTWGKYVKKILPFVPHRVGLTATPAPNGLEDLFGQYYVLDDGERLGKNFSNFRSNYFESDYMGYSHTVTERGKKFIQEAVSDITIQMDADDYLDLPDNRELIIEVSLPPKLQAQYDLLEKQMFLELDSGELIEPENAATLMGKCLQFVSGAVYTDPEDRTVWEDIHKIKIDALIETIKDLNGEPLLLGYQFKHDAARIKARFDKEKINYVHFDSKIKGKEATELVDDWNNGKYAVMLGHGQSVGHGNNLQYGCSTVGWYGLPWSSEVYKQFNGRVIKRQGQKKKTKLLKFLVDNTVDYAVLEALNTKSATQAELKQSVQTYRRRKGV